MVRIVEPPRTGVRGYRVVVSLCCRPNDREMSFGTGTFGATPAPEQDVAVSEQPTDGISTLAWSSTADFLAASSWDGKVRVYQAALAPSPAAQLVASYEHGAGQSAPVLDICWAKDGSKIYSVGVDKRGVIYDSASQQSVQFAQHDEPIKCVRTVQIGTDPSDYIATASWDRTLRYWDPRSPREMSKVQLHERAYTMDFVAPWLVVGCADRHIGILDTRQGPDRINWTFSSLKWQTRVVACFPAIGNDAPRLGMGQLSRPESSAGYVIGGIEGRIAVVYHDPTVQKDHGFSFRCHRKEFKTGMEREAEKRKAAQEGRLNEYGAFAINSVSYNVNGTYATAGSDGGISIWDNYSKSRLKLFDKKPAPVSATAFNRDASMFAYGVSYDWSQGHQGNNGKPTAVMIHRCKVRKFVCDVCTSCLRTAQPEEVRRKAKR